MTKYLVTHSLISSLQWYLKESFTKTDEQQRQEFLQTLHRVKSEPNEAMQKGLDFEEKIKFFCETGFFKGLGQAIDESELTLRDEYDDIVCPKSAIVKHNHPESEIDFIIQKLGQIVKGGIWQHATKKDLSVNGYDILLYGRCDVIKADTVFDIKYTSNYELGKYQDSGQHWIYLYCTGLPKFSYLISDGKEWWREDYFNHARIEGEIKSKVSEFLDYLESDKEAKELYFNNWVSK